MGSIPPPFSSPDGSPTCLTSSKRLTRKSSHLVRLSSFFTSRLDRSFLTPEAAEGSGVSLASMSVDSYQGGSSPFTFTPPGPSTSSTVRSPLDSTDGLSPLSFNHHGSNSPNDSYPQTHPMLKSTNPHYSLTPLLSNVKAISNSFKSSEKTRISTTNQHNRQAKVKEASPSKDLAVKFGLDFIPTEACQSILTHANTTVVKIAGLSEEEVQDLLVTSFPQSTISAELVKLVHDISSGNAYWCKQIIRIFQEQGLESMNSYIADNTSLVGSKSHSLRMLILLRLEKLSTEQQLVLKLASILSDVFTEKIISCLLPKVMKKINVSDCLQALIEHDFLYKLQDHPVGLFGFQNQIIQSTLYDLLPPR
ncbi:hypothetical protein EON65_13510 [archaeon]|nr:MAG: hypothetical protein EON65_13510 [archaeon]